MAAVSSPVASASPASAASASAAAFSLADWHRIHRSLQAWGGLTKGNGLLLSRKSSSQLLSPSSPSTGLGPAEFVREDLVCKNAHGLLEEYTLESIIGKGSFGQVHRAVHIRTGIHRAIKELPKLDTLPDEFEFELRALVALDHPHIVQVIEHFEDDDKYYIVMELCNGPDLFKYIVENTETNLENPKFIPERDVSIILRQCLKAVLCCHAHGFVHRDLNAKNFMITGSDRTVKLIDFGLATRFLPNDEYEEIAGTAHYMAPEMMLYGQWTSAVDMWSLGVLFFVTLTGTLLLPNDDAKKKKLLGQPDFSERRLQRCRMLAARGISPIARDLLQQMLTYDPEERVTAAQALSSPFVLAHSEESLGPTLDLALDFDKEVVRKMRRFARAPRLKKVALLISSHLASMEVHEQELLRAQHAFRTMDRDGDGEITPEELEDALKNIGAEVPSDLREVFRLCDSSGSGTLTFVEFKASVLPEDAALDERSCSEVFNVLDRDGDGRVGAEDLRSAHPAFDLRTCQKIVAEADLEAKGWLEFYDIHRFLRGASAAAASAAAAAASASAASAASAVAAVAAAAVSGGTSGETACAGADAAASSVDAEVAAVDAETVEPGAEAGAEGGESAPPAAKRARAE